MTISSTTRKAGPYVGNSSATSFAFAFKVFVTSDVVVTLTDIATGAETVLTLTTHYTVSLNADQNANPGGSVTYNPSGTPIPSTKKLTITSGVPNLQGTDIVNSGGIYLQVIEDALDKRTIIEQQEAEKSLRALRFPVSDSPLVGTLPAAAQRANKALIFDASGNVDVSEDDFNDQAASAAASAAAAAAAAVAADASADAAAVSAANAAADAAMISPAMEPVTAAATIAVARNLLYVYNNDATVRIASDATAKGLYLVYHEGNALSLWNGSIWVRTQVPGDYLHIDTTDCTVEGVAHQALAASTTYWIYAYLTGGTTLAVDFSTTAPTPGDPSGFLLKFGDGTRRLIGAVATDASSVIWEAGSRGVTKSMMGSYHHRQRIALQSQVAVTAGFNHTTWTIYDGTKTLSAWVWGDGADPEIFLSGSMSGDTIGMQVYVGISINGESPPYDNVTHIPLAGADAPVPFCVVGSGGAYGTGPMTFDIVVKCSSNNGKLWAPCTFYLNLDQ